MESITLCNKDIVNKRNYYSMLLMKIRTIKQDVSDMTLSIPLSVLPKHKLGIIEVILLLNLFNYWELSMRQSVANILYN